MACIVRAKRSLSSGPVTTSLRVPTLPGHDFNLPAELEGLGDLAYNLWWSWTPRAQSLFSRINLGAWARHRNPIAVLRYSDQARWSELTADEDFMVDASRVLDEFNRYMAIGLRWRAHAPRLIRLKRDCARGVQL